MSKPSILLDVDGVVADFISAFADVTFEVTERRFTAADVTEWDISKCFGLNPTTERMVYDRIKAPGFAYDRIQPYPGAIEGVRLLRELADVFFVTSPMRNDPHGHGANPLTWMHDREHWLHRHFDVDQHHVVHTSAKQLVRGDVFVDDKPEHVERWRAAHPDGRAFIWDRPYSQQTSNRRARRVRGWDELIAQVKPEIWF